MGVSNEEIVLKNIIGSDQISVSGKLNPAQSDKFIDFVIDETVLKDNARVVRFRNEQMEIDKIGLGKRVALPKSEGVDPGKRRGVKTSKIVLQPREIIVPFEIGDNFRELNIEGDAVEDHIIRIMATQLANDLEELYINGNTLGPANTVDFLDGFGDGSGDTAHYELDRYNGLFDGWFTKAEQGHVVDAAGQNIGLTLFDQLIRALPTKFRRNKASLRYFLSSDLWQLYQSKFATRQTIAGDAAAGGEMFGPFGIAPIPVPLFNFLPQKVEHIVLTGTTNTALKYTSVTSVVVTASTLGDTPVTPYVVSPDGSAGDYVLDAAAGTIKRTAGSAISGGATVKVTYNSGPQVLLTHKNNMIVGIGRDIRIEKDRDIMKGVNQYAVTCKVVVQFEELDAIALLKNVGTGL